MAEPHPYLERLMGPEWARRRREYDERQAREKREKDKIAMDRFGCSYKELDPGEQGVVDLQWLQDTKASDVAGGMLQALERWTVDDISYETMSRIARRVRYLPHGASAIRVADIIGEEIGPEKALEYVEKAHAGALISTREYNELRAALILTLPRERIPVPRAAIGRMELLEAQKRLQREFAALGEAGRAAVTAPMRALNKDVERLRRAWGG